MLDHPKSCLKPDPFFADPMVAGIIGDSIKRMVENQHEDSESGMSARALLDWALDAQAWISNEIANQRQRSNTDDDGKDYANRMSHVIDATIMHFALLTSQLMLSLTKEVHPAKKTLFLALMVKKYSDYCGDVVNGAVDGEVVVGTFDEKNKKSTTDFGTMQGVFNSGKL